MEDTVDAKNETHRENLCCRRNELGSFVGSR
jgi:hypothetical protein